MRARQNSSAMTSCNRLERQFKLEEIALRIYVANRDDTLRKIARRYQMDLEHIQYLNPLITDDPDMYISGINVKLPLDSSSVWTPVIPVCNEITPPRFIDHWIPTVSVDSMAQTEYDVLIVGSGAGGGAVLWRLCEQWAGSGKKIGMLERGNLLLPSNAYNIETLDGRINQLYLNPKIRKLVGNSPWFPGFTEVHALGGRTIFWAGLSPSMPYTEFEQWPVTVEEMDFYYKIAKQVMNVSQAYMEASPSNEMLLDRLWDGHIREAMNLPLALDIEPSRYGEIHSNAYFSSITFLARALNRNSFDLAVNARATKIITENGKAVGVEIMTPDKRPHILRAKTIVISASTVETPRLLLHSDISGEAIGHYLINHSSVHAIGMLDRKVLPSEMGTIGLFIPKTSDRPYQVQIEGPVGYNSYHEKLQASREQVNIRIACLGRVEPRYENRIMLDSNKKDDYGVPEVNIHFTYNERDNAVIYEAAGAARNLASLLGMKLIPWPSGSEVCQIPPNIGSHESGTCRMGEDPDQSATDRFGKVHGIAGLYIADNSVLPTLGASPTLTTVALSIRTADQIIKSLAR